MWTVCVQPNIYDHVHANKQYKQNLVNSFKCLALTGKPSHEGRNIDRPVNQELALHTEIHLYHTLV